MAMTTALSALAELWFLWKERKSLTSRDWVGAGLVAALSLAYSGWAIVGAGTRAILWGSVLWLVGILLYFVMKRIYANTEPNTIA